MMTNEEIIRTLASKSDFFRLGSCETETLVNYADDWNDDWAEDEKDLYRKAADYYDNHDFRPDGEAWYLEEKDGDGIWRTIAFGTGGKPFAYQCEEMVEQLLRKTYIYSCTNGYRDWSRVPKAKSREELALKLATLGV